MPHWTCKSVMQWCSAAARWTQGTNGCHSRRPALALQTPTAPDPSPSLACKQQFAHHTLPLLPSVTYQGNESWELGRRANSAESSQGVSPQQTSNSMLQCNAFQCNALKPQKFEGLAPQSYEAANKHKRRLRLPTACVPSLRYQTWLHAGCR